MSVSDNDFLCYHAIFFVFHITKPSHVFNKELLKMRRDSRGHMYK